MIRSKVTFRGFSVMLKPTPSGKFLFGIVDSVSFLKADNLSNHDVIKMCLGLCH